MIGVIIAVLSTGVGAVPPSDNCGSWPAAYFPPQWPDGFTASWTLRAMYSSPTLYSEGFTKYSWNGGSNPKMIWARADGQVDPYCAGALPMGTKESECQHIVIGGQRYMYYKGLDQCCICCDSGHGCGVPAPDFMQNATHIGTDYYEGKAVNYWQYLSFVYIETQDFTPTSRDWVGVKSTNYFYPYVWSFTRTTPTITLPAACGGAGLCGKGQCDSRQNANPSWPAMFFD